jgi:hypothetical protein
VEERRNGEKEEGRLEDGGRERRRNGNRGNEVKEVKGLHGNI